MGAVIRNSIYLEGAKNMAEMYSTLKRNVYWMVYRNWNKSGFKYSVANLVYGQYCTFQKIYCIVAKNTKGETVCYKKPNDIQKILEKQQKKHQFTIIYGSF